MSEIDLAKLRDPFPAEDVEWRVQSCGKSGEKIWAMVLCYVTNRAIMDRLDAVCGPANWKNRFMPGPDGGIVCGISIKVGDEWVEKIDGAENTQVEAIKGGLSSSMKRAGVPWGIGRYLYNLDATFADTSPDKRAYENKGYEAKTKMAFSWKTPTLPVWALPGGLGKPDANAPKKTPPKKQAPKKQAPPKDPPPVKPLTAVQGKAILALGADNDLSEAETRKVIDWYCGQPNIGRTVAAGQDLINGFIGILHNYMDDKVNAS